MRRFVDGLAASTVAVTNTVKSCFDLQSFGADTICASLARDVYTADAFKLNARFTLPTLFLNGALDTQTQPGETDLVRTRFTNSKEVLLPAYIGHFSYLNGGGCADEIVTAFLAGNEQSLPPSCSADALCAGLPLVPRLIP